MTKDMLDNARDIFSEISFFEKRLETIQEWKVHKSDGFVPLIIKLNNDYAACDLLFERSILSNKIVDLLEEDTKKCLMTVKKQFEEL